MARMTWRPLRALTAALVLGSALLAGCPKIGGPLARAGDRVVPIRLPEPAYEELFPYYASLCALSRFNRLGIERGGSAGHAVLYLKGVCRDEAAPFPTLMMCPERVDDVHDRRHGVGVSVNASFRNVNWVAYPGRALFFNGNLRRGQPLTQAHLEATRDAIVAEGLLRGVEAREEKLTGVLPGSHEQRIAESLLGTDVAIRFARSAWCTAVPLERDQMERVVEHLNGLNQHYAESEDGYEYSLFYDNCLRALHDSLAAAGVWAPRKHRSRFLGQVRQMGVPANEVAKLAVRTNLFDIENFDAVRRDPAMRESLERFGWLPTRPGALLETGPVHRPNELYDTSLQMFAVEGPRAGATGELSELVTDARYTQLEPNLLYWQERYQRILASRSEGLVAALGRGPRPARALLRLRRPRARGRAGSAPAPLPGALTGLALPGRRLALPIDALTTDPQPCAGTRSPSHPPAS